MDRIVDILNEFFVIGVAAYIVRGWIAGKVVAYGRKFLVKTERDRAIVSHYSAQALGQGHGSASVLDCGEGKCAVFGGVRAVV